MDRLCAKRCILCISSAEPPGEHCSPGSSAEGMHKKHIKMKIEQKMFKRARVINH